MEGKKIGLSALEAAELIGISKTKMYEVMRREDVDFVVRLGGRTLISRKKLEEWFDRQAGRL